VPVSAQRTRSSALCQVRAEPAYAIFQTSAPSPRQWRLTGSLKLPAKVATPTACPRRRSRQGIHPWQRARSPVTIKREQPFQGHDMGRHPPRPDGPGGRRHVAGARTHDPPPRRIRGLGHRGSGGADLDQPLGGPASARSAQEDDPIAVTVRSQPSVPPTCPVGRQPEGNTGELRRGRQERAGRRLAWSPHDRIRDLPNWRHGAKSGTVCRPRTAG
jgi:hypothetical protein